MYTIHVLYSSILYDLWSSQLGFLKDKKQRREQSGKCWQLFSQWAGIAVWLRAMYRQTERDRCKVLEWMPDWRMGCGKLCGTQKPKCKRSTYDYFYYGAARTQWQYHVSNVSFFPFRLKNV